MKEGPDFDKRPALGYWLVFAAICIVGSVFVSAFAHPQADCNRNTNCDYVQVETPNGGVKMVYVCE